MSPLRVSVALCTYNGAAYLGEQLRSIAEGTRAPDELVLCDDRSSDATLAIAESFATASRFPVRIVVNETNLGSRRNFEGAIRRCTGDVVALADQDDAWEPRKLATLAGAFERDPDLAMAFSDADVVDDRLQSLGYALWDGVLFTAGERRALARGEGFGVLLRHNVVTGAAMAFRRSWADLVLPIGEGWVHDGWIALLLSAAGRCAAIPERLVRYRQHASQQIGAPAPGLRSQLAAARRLIERGVYRGAPAAYRAARDRLAAYPGPLLVPDALERLDAKVRHLEARNRIHARTPLAPWLLARELATRRYHRYSLGAKNAAQDVLAMTVWKAGRG